MRITNNTFLPKCSTKAKINFGVKPEFSSKFKSTSILSNKNSFVLLETLKALQNMVKPLFSSINKTSENKKIINNQELEKKFRDSISEDTLSLMKQYFPTDEQDDITLETFMPHYSPSGSLVYNLSDFIKTLDVQLSVPRMQTYSIKNVPNLKVFNGQIAGLMQKNYNKNTLQQMKKLLTDNNVFLFKIDKNTGLSKTSGVSETENWEMGARVWITDSMHIANDYLRYNDINTLKATLLTFAKFYADDAQKKIFDKIHDSDKYKDEMGKEHNELYEPKDYIEGVHNIQGIAHVLITKNGKCEPDEQWFNNKRLESHGLALQTFSKMIISGLRTENKKDYGYQSAAQIPKEVKTSIAYLVRYFYDINYPYARTAGNWEEVPFEGGTACDTATIVKALNTFSDLMFNKDYDKNEQITQIREDILNEMAGIGFQCEQATIQKMIANGYERLSKAFCKGTFEEHPLRPYDATSLFITNMNGLKFSEDPLDDINKKRVILGQLEDNLVGEYGIMRYKDDSYLNTNYNLAQTPEAKISFTWKEKLEDFGSKDASTKEAQEERKHLVDESNHEAQWTFQSQMSVGYLKLLSQLNLAIEQGFITLNDETIAKAKELKENVDLNLNRALARITDDKANESNQIKANGEISPSWAVPEAYQAVTYVNPDSNEVEVKYTVGINTPLAWGQCGLYKAFYSYEKLIENLTPELSKELNL